VQDGAELLPTFGWPSDRLLVLLAGGADALLRAVEGAEDNAEYAARLVREHQVGERDALIAVAASGTTPFTVTVLREARRAGAATIGMANNRDTPLLISAEHPVLLDTGAEPIAGSTRMKAGTAQRVALTVLSSLVMIRLGRVYRGLMVEIQGINSKLARRSEDILMQLTGIDRNAARKALSRTGGDLKAAIRQVDHDASDKRSASVNSAAGPQARSMRPTNEEKSAKRRERPSAVARRSTPASIRTRK
jgi:N-acetylmuramic acid 6-phosphate etherase